MGWLDGAGLAGGVGAEAEVVMTPRLATDRRPDETVLNPVMPFQGVTGPGNGPGRQAVG
ncbi:hypothetical protein Ga0074812_11276 [Parafrankia irregularis]|uniref:Uncharacterized protein n=1 Tax=Parafrankia irregularis TaxID=795642 RepID=A0A0S4QR94_9ACTN|nr:hypothetical protein Ga0074812_11276 [Parafrankia irregularis]